MVTAGIEKFEDLKVWQEAQDLAVKIYDRTQSFPDKEIFGLTNQLRRAAASISANIAEGFGRPSSKDKIHFMSIAYGSLLETKNFIYLSEKIGYIDTEKTTELIDDCVTCQKLLNGFMRSLRR